MNGLPQNVLLKFRLEFPKSDLTIYLPSGISEIFCQMVSTLGLGKVGVGGGCIFKILVAKGGGGVQFSYEIILGGTVFIHHTFLKPPPPPPPPDLDVINDRSLKVSKTNQKSICSCLQFRKEII